MSTLLALSSKLDEVKTELKNILASHGIIVTDDDSLDYYLEKLKTLKIVNQDKKIMYAGNYNSEEGYSGFGNIIVDCQDGSEFLNDIYTNTQSEAWATLLPKYNNNNSEAEYIKNPYSGPSTLSYVTTNYTGTVVTDVRFNNVKKILTGSDGFNLNYTGFRSIETLTFPDLFYAEYPTTGTTSYYNFINGQNSSNTIALTGVYLPQLNFAQNYSCICRYLRNLVTLSTPNLKVVYGALAIDCAKLLNVDLSNLEEIKRACGANSSYYYSNSLIDGGLFTQINLSKLNKLETYYSFLLSRCQNLTSLVLPKLESWTLIGSYGYLINDCRAIEYISLPKLKEIPNYLFVNYAGSSGSSSSTTTNALTTIHFKDLQTIHQYLTVDNAYLCFPNLNTIILEGDQVTSLNSATWWNGNQTSRPHFYNKTASIYVPNDLVDDYKEATNWSTLKDMIKPLSEYNDPYNLITRYNGYMDINITQDNCITYINNRKLITDNGVIPSIDIKGNVPIDENNIATISGGNSTNYLQLTGFPTVGSLLLKIKFTQWNIGSIFLEDSFQYCCFGFDGSTHKLSEYMSNRRNSVTTPNLNTWYWLRFQTNGTNISCQLLLDNEYTTTTLPTTGWTQENIFSRTNWWLNYSTFYIGKSNYSNESFYGQIDLNSIVIIGIDDWKVVKFDDQHFLNLPFYTDKSYNVKITNEDYQNDYITSLKFDDITKKTVNIDLDNITYKTLTINTNVQDPTISCKAYGYDLNSNTNIFTLPINTPVIYRILKREYLPYEKALTINDNIIENIELEYTGRYVDVDLQPGKTTVGWKISTKANPKENNNWLMYESERISSYSGNPTYVTMKVRFKGYSTFKCYINGYGYDSYNYTFVSALDSESYTSIYNSYSTSNKAYPPETFGSPNWTEVTFTTSSPNTEHYFYVTYREYSYYTYNYRAGFLLFDPYQ